MINYKHLKLQDSVKISSVVNASRHRIQKDFIFTGESHNFCEMQYAALGSAIIQTNDEFYELRQGQLAFFAPNKFHLMTGNGHHSAELWVFSFRCDSPFIEKFDQTVISVPEEIKYLMKNIVEESERNFTAEQEPTDGRILKRRPQTVFGYEQIIKNLLEILLLQLFRYATLNPGISVESIINLIEPSSLAEEIRFYLQKHTHSTLSLSQLSRVYNLSASYLKSIYKKTYSVSIMADFNQMKLHGIMNTLSSTNLSIQQISDLFDFSSVYYFSNYFKRYTGISPSHYRKKISNELMPDS